MTAISSISGGLWGGNYFSPSPQAVSASEAQLQADARKLVTEAEAAGGSASLQYSYATGPDGRPYISAIRVTKTTPKTVETAIPSEDRLADLTAAEQRRVAELQAADIAVRNHEALHYRAAGGIASGTPEYSYVQGPDGKYYAVEGAVHTHTTATNNPEKAARDAAALALSALAPGDASAADIAAARQAGAQAAESYARALQAGKPAGTPSINFSI